MSLLTTLLLFVFCVIVGKSDYIAAISSTSSEIQSSLPNISTTLVSKNQIITKFIHAVNLNLEKSRKDRVSIPKINTTITNKDVIPNLHGNLVAENGWCQHLSSLKQIGNVKIYTNQDNPALNFYMKLRQLEFGFASYTASIIPIGLYTTGCINATIHDNLIHCQVTLKYKNKKCMVSHIEINIEKLVAPEINFEMEEGFEWLNMEVLTSLYYSYLPNITLIVLNHIKNAMSQVSDDICSFFSQ